jgi:hypothetical protein
MPRKDMNKAKRTSEEYAKWFDDVIRSYVEPLKAKWVPTEAYLQRNALLVTLNYDKKELGRRKPASDVSPTDRSPEFDALDLFYKRACRKLLGSNYARRRPEQPLMIAAADVNGTRYWKSAGAVENVHLHTIWVFRPGQVNGFEEWCQGLSEGAFGLGVVFRQIDVRTIEAMAIDGKVPSRVSGYVSKFLGFNAETMAIGEDVAIYPT